MLSGAHFFWPAIPLIFLVVGLVRHARYGRWRPGVHAPRTGTGTEPAALSGGRPHVRRWRSLIFFARSATVAEFCSGRDNAT